MIKKNLADELKKIIKEDYLLDLDKASLFELADSLIDYFSVLINIKNQKKQNYEKSISRS